MTMKTHKLIPGCAAAAVAFALAVNSTAQAAAIVGQPQIQTQTWAGFSEPLGTIWSYKTTVKRPGTAVPANHSLRVITPLPPFTGTLQNPSTPDLDATAEARVVVDLGLYKHIAPAHEFVELIPRAAVENLTYDWFSRADAKTAAFENGKKYFARDIRNEQQLLAVASRVLSSEGSLLGQARSYANVDYDVTDTGFTAQGRVMASSSWRKPWRNDINTAVRSRATFTTTYEVTRDSDFDLSAVLAGSQKSRTRLVIRDADTGEVIYRFRRHGGATHRVLDFSGQLEAGRYQFHLTANTLYRRNRSGFYDRGGAGEFDVNFSATSVLSDEQLLLQAAAGDLPLEDLLDIFNLNEDKLTDIIVDNRLPIAYLYELTGLDDLGLIEQVLRGEKIAELLDLLPGFAFFDGDDVLLYDSINGIHGDPQTMDWRHWLANGDEQIIAPFITEGADYRIQFLPIPEPGSLALAMAGGVLLLGWRRQS